MRSLSNSREDFSSEVLSLHVKTQVETSQSRKDFTVKVSSSCVVAAERSQHHQFRILIWRNSKKKTLNVPTVGDFFVPEQIFFPLMVFNPDIRFNKGSTV